MTLLHIIAQLLLGWLIADLLSGFFHWLEDRVLWSDMPLLGRFVVEPNRLHHENPSAFVSSSLIERNWTAWTLAAVLSLAWFAIAGPSWIWLGALAGGLVATEIHVRAHRPIVKGSLFSALQEVGIIQSARQHGAHHGGAMDRRYCVLTDWLNPLLDWARLWAGLEWIMSRLGLEPNRGTK